MNPVHKIQEMLTQIDAASRNNTDSIYINVVTNEFITFNGRITIPKIPVKELSYDSSVAIIESIAGYIPEFLCRHELLAERMPPSEQHSLQFARKTRGELLEFIHLFKIDLRFGGDSSNVVERGDSDHYPAYTTDRVYYKSRLIPVLGESVGESIQYFKSIRLLDSTYVGSDQYFHTFAVFEDVNRKDLTREILAKIDNSIFNISTELYSFIEYDYFTSCFNVLYPTADEIEIAVGMYEPIFLSILSRYKDIGELLPTDTIRDHFADSITHDEDRLSLNDAFLHSLKRYFQRFSISRDDDLALKGWWRIDIET